MIERNLNVDIANVVDLINIKNLPEMIANYLQSKGVKKYCNLRKFYSSMFDYFSDDIRDSYLNRILKYLSSDTPSEIYFIDDINDGLYDKELMDFSTDLVNIINEFEDCNTLYEKLNRKINFIFYETDDDNIYSIVKDYNNNKEYPLFIFALLKHAFLNYKISLPGIAGKRLYINARTLKYGTDNYIRCLYAASCLGNDDATILLCGILEKYDINKATEILLGSKENEMVLWIVGFSLENNKLNKEIVSLIRNKYKYIFEYSDDFIDSISATEKSKKRYYDTTLLMAYKIYYYCYNKYSYTKAGNSLGKLLIFDIVSYKNDRKKSIELGKKFLKTEMIKGNVNAITNIAIYFYDNPSDNEYTEEEIKKILKTSASFGDILGNYYLGKILFDEGEYEDAYNYLSYSAGANNGPSFLLLGNYYELKNDYDDAVESYRKGIVNGCFDCAYHLALLYFNLTEVQQSNKVVLEQLGYDYLNKYMNLFSEEIKKKAEILLNKKNT